MNKRKGRENPRFPLDGSNGTFFLLLERVNGLCARFRSNQREQSLVLRDGQGRGVGLLLCALLLLWELLGRTGIYKHVLNYIALCEMSAILNDFLELGLLSAWMLGRLRDKA